MGSLLIFLNNIILGGVGEGCIVGLCYGPEVKRTVKSQIFFVQELIFFLNVCFDGFARVINLRNFMLIKETCTIGSHIRMIVGIQPVCRPFPS